MNLGYEVARNPAKWDAEQAELRQDGAGEEEDELEDEEEDEEAAGGKRKKAAKEKSKAKKPKTAKKVGLFPDPRRELGWACSAGVGLAREEVSARKPGNDGTLGHRYRDMADLRNPKPGIVS